MKKKVLWIEDQAVSMLTEYMAKVNHSKKYSTDPALSASDGMRRIRQNEYAVVIVDIRLDPGEDSEWIECLFRHGGDRRQARLGMELLKLLFMPEKAEVKLNGFQKPPWITPERIGVLTVEGKPEVSRDLNDMHITSYKQKIAGAGNSLLLDLIEEIVSKGV